MATGGGTVGAGRVLSFLAFDFGTHRVGVASGNTLLGRAAPLATLALQGDARFAAIEKLVAEWQPDALVVGVPFHPDGAAHDNTRRAERFARQLHGRLKLPVHLADERYTTTEALAAGAAEADVDALAAAVILDQHLRGLSAAGAGPALPAAADARAQGALSSGAAPSRAATGATVSADASVRHRDAAA